MTIMNVLTMVNIWMKLFGRTELLGLDMGFWVSMAVVAIIVIAMNIIFWGMKPKKDNSSNKSNSL